MLTYASDIRTFSLYCSIYHPIVYEKSTGQEDGRDGRGHKHQRHRLKIIFWGRLFEGRLA